jgi:hypothetical protein
VPPWMQQQPPLTEMRAWVLEKYARGSLSAKDVCTLAWTARTHPDLGMSDLALSPTETGGHFERRIATALGMPAYEKRQVFFSEVPLQAKDHGRIASLHPFLLPHETVAASAVWDRASMVPGADAAVLAVPHIASHPVLVEHGPQGCVLAHAYTDSVPYSGTTTSAPDSVYVFAWTPFSTHGMHRSGGLSRWCRSPACASVAARAAAR